MCFGKMIAKLYKPCDYEEIIKFDVPKAEIYFSTIYLGDISKNIAKDLKELLASNYPQIRLNLVYKAYSTIGNHFVFKDRQPQDCKSNLIYRYTCERCKAFYIGKTKKQFAVRIAEHKGISVRTGKPFQKITSDV